MSLVVPSATDTLTLSPVTGLSYPSGPISTAPDAEFWIGDARDVATALPEGYLQSLIFSPPYYGLRRYKSPPALWIPPTAGAPCTPDAHSWGPLLVAKASDNYNEGFNERWGFGAGEKRQEAAKPKALDYGRFCERPTCLAWEGHLGNEPTPAMFIDNLMTVVGLFRRILRKDGTLWMVIGDSYAGSGRGPAGKSSQIPHDHRQGFSDATGKADPAVAKILRDFRRGPGWWGVADKCLLMIPHRVGIRMASEGWIVRNDIIWDKPNASPHPVEDRFINAHEFVWFAAKTESKGRYYFDQTAVLEVSVTSKRGRVTEIVMEDGSIQTAGGRNRRDIWSIPTATAHTKSDHFATYGTKLPELMVLASTSAAGACPRCYAPFERMIFKETAPNEVKRAYARRSDFHPTNSGLGGSVHQQWLDDHPPITYGWRPTCKCGCQAPVETESSAGLCGAPWTALTPAATKQELGDDGEYHTITIKPATERFLCDHDTTWLVRCRVGDLFGGSGTTLAVCRALSRYGVYGDISPEYGSEASARAEGTQPGLGLF